MEDLKRMAIFATVVQQGSMSAAARLLDMSPSAVSQHIRQLERQAGVTLLHRSTRQIALNRINRKHFDFILCRPDDLTVLCAIELNDASHQRKDRQERDEFLETACRSAGLPLILFDARHAYSPMEISARIAEVIAGGIPVRQKPALQPVPQGDNPVPENEIAPFCPRCSGTMVKRIAKGGENAGKEFWGCTSFPKCTEVLKI